MIKKILLLSKYLKNAGLYDEYNYINHTLKVAKKNNNEDEDLEEDEILVDKVDPISGSPYYPSIHSSSIPDGGVPPYGDSTTNDDNYVNIYRGIPTIS